MAVDCHVAAGRWGCTALPCVQSALAKPATMQPQCLPCWTLREKKLKNATPASPESREFTAAVKSCYIRTRMASEADVPFTKKMRIVTRDIHNISDALINAKIGIAMSADRVWAEGLLVFYEIFRYLENALDRYSHTLVGELDITGMRRTQAFEKDLSHYLGQDWKVGYAPRESVCQYLKHLQKIEQENPHYLMAYIYHLYMGLLSGGQILRRKKTLLQRLKFSTKESVEGMAVTEITDTSVFKMKKQMSEAMERVAQEVDEETRQRLLEESKMVFILNNNMVYSIQGAGTVVTIKLIKVGVFGALGVLLFTYLKKFLFG
ncbi:hypothetical protein Pcinc_000396 [Petrolisthes cinctipes]|uniref:Heme oxygenase n=1 Tax=Petrolisthes cinctipes TaxID=88211 RepID=A0AAE1GS60_PETCI|nr:hypothetical protein Pcinc_000396 [Petrolisthes cinctipes]